MKRSGVHNEASKGTRRDGVQNKNPHASQRKSSGVSVYGSLRDDMNEAYCGEFSEQRRRLLREAPPPRENMNETLWG